MRWTAWLPKTSSTPPAASNSRIPASAWPCPPALHIRTSARWSRSPKRSICYSVGGASGIYFQQLITKLGIADVINAKASPIPSGFTAEKLLTGDADLAVQQVSELKVVPAAEIIGKFPEELQLVTSFSAAIMRSTTNPEAAARLIASLTGPQAAIAYRESGVDPI